MCIQDQSKCDWACLASKWAMPSLPVSSLLPSFTSGWAEAEPITAVLKISDTGFDKWEYSLTQCLTKGNVFDVPDEPRRCVVSTVKNVTVCHIPFIKNVPKLEEKSNRWWLFQGTITNGNAVSELWKILAQDLWVRSGHHWSPGVPWDINVDHMLPRFLGPLLWMRRKGWFLAENPLTCEWARLLIVGELLRGIITGRTYWVTENRWRIKLVGNWRMAGSKTNWNVLRQVNTK